MTFWSTPSFCSLNRILLPRPWMRMRIQLAAIGVAPSIVTKLLPLAGKRRFG